jgi:hypothetical protein
MTSIKEFLSLMFVCFMIGGAILGALVLAQQPAVLSAAGDALAQPAAIPATASPTPGLSAGAATAQAAASNAQATLLAATDIVRSTQDAIAYEKALAVQAEQKRLGQIATVTVAAGFAQGTATMQAQQTGDALIARAREIELERQALQVAQERAQNTVVAQAATSTAYNAMQSASRTQAAIITEDALGVLPTQAAIQRRIEYDNLVAGIWNATCVFIPTLLTGVLIFAFAWAVKRGQIENEKSQRLLEVFETRQIGTVQITKNEDGSYTVRPLQQAYLERPRKNLGSSEEAASDFDNVEFSKGGVTATSKPAPKNQGVKYSRLEDFALYVLGRSIEKYGRTGERVLPASEFSSQAIWQEAVDALKAVDAVETHSQGTGPTSANYTRTSERGYYASPAPATSRRIRHRNTLEHVEQNRTRWNTGEKQL